MRCIKIRSVRVHAKWTGEAHARETGSQKAAEIRRHWDDEKRHFIQVCPKEMLDKLEHPISQEIAAMSAE